VPGGAPRLPWDAAVTVAAVATRTAALAPVLLAARSRLLRRTVWPLVAGLGLVSGMAADQGRAARPYAAVAAPWSVAAPVEARGRAVVRLTGWAAAAGRGWRAPARVMAWNSGGASAEPAVGAGLMLRGDGAPPTPGALLRGDLTVRPPRPAGVPGDFDQPAFLAGRDLRWQADFEGPAAPLSDDAVSRLGARWLAPARRACRQGLDRLLPPPEAAMAGAVLLGARTRESRELGANYSDLGLAHLFAVSGLHVGILLGCFLLPAHLLGLSPAWRLAPAALLLPAYAVLTGLPGSVVRAAGVGVLALAAPVAGRHGGDGQSWSEVLYAHRC